MTLRIASLPQRLTAQRQIARAAPDPMGDPGFCSSPSFPFHLLHVISWHRTINAQEEIGVSGAAQLRAPQPRSQLPLNVGSGCCSPKRGRWWTLTQTHYLGTWLLAARTNRRRSADIRDPFPHPPILAPVTSRGRLCTGALNFAEADRAAAHRAHLVAALQARS